MCCCVITNYDIFNNDLSEYKRKLAFVDGDHTYEGALRDVQLCCQRGFDCIVVDDTVHFLSKYLRARRENNASSEEAVVYAFKNVGFALIVTTVALVGGFAVLAMSGFKVNSDMAKLTAITIAIALSVDLTFLPSLLMYLDREKKSSSNKDNQNK